jgi:DHA1 family multidrug resistance protein-like MFS transporter
VERRVFLTLALYSLLASNRGGLFTVFFVLYLSSVKGASIGVALIILSAAYVGGSLIGPIAGRWSDRLGRRWPFLVIGEAASLPFFIAVPFLPGYIASGGAFIAAEMILALGSPALNAYVTDITKQGERGWGFGFLQATGAVGAIVGFLLAGYLVDLYGFNVLFYMVGAIMIGTITIVVFFVPDRESPKLSTQRPWRELTSVSKFSFTVSIRALGAGAVVTFYGTYAYLLGANAFDISLIAIAGLVVTALFSIEMGRVVDRYGEIRGMLWGTAISVAAMVLYLVAVNWVELIPARATYQFGFALMNPAMLSWVARIAPPNRRAEYLGVFSLINSTLWSLGPLLGGIAWSLAGAPGLFIMAIGSTLISLGAIEFFYMVKQRGIPEGPGPAVTLDEKVIGGGG